MTNIFQHSIIQCCKSTFNFSVAGVWTEILSGIAILHGAETIEER